MAERTTRDTIRKRTYIPAKSVGRRILPVVFENPVRYAYTRVLIMSAPKCRYDAAIMALVRVLKTRAFRVT